MKPKLKYTIISVYHDKKAIGYISVNNTVTEDFIPMQFGDAIMECYEEWKKEKGETQ